MSKIPSVHIPTVIRTALLKKAIWDSLRTKLSYDQAKSVQSQVEADVFLVLEDAIVRGQNA